MLVTEQVSPLLRGQGKENRMCRRDVGVALGLGKLSQLLITMKRIKLLFKEEGVAVFKLYAVHSGHEPGPFDGNARIMHRVVGHKNGLLMDEDSVYGVSEEMEIDGFGDLQVLVLQQVQELRAELSFLDGKVSKLLENILGAVSQELYEVVHRVRIIGSMDDVLICESDLAHWSNHHSQIYGKGADLIEDDEDSFGRSLGDVVPWDTMRTEQKDLMCKNEKWLKCGNFDEKIILDKLSKHNESIVGDEGLAGIQVDSFYQDNPKWYDSACGLDSGADCGDSGFRHEEIV